MKKLNILMIMLITSFVFMACEKEEATITDKTDDQKAKVLAPPGGNVELTILNIQDPVELWCQVEGGNCLPEVVITAPKLETFEEYIAEGSSGVREYFIDEDLWGNMFPVLNETPDFLKKLQSGNYAIETYVQEDGTHIWKATHVDNEEDYFGLTGAYDEE